jgi:hypothetical protein
LELEVAKQSRTAILLMLIGLQLSCSNAASDNFPLVEIWLGQSRALIKGYEWPQYKDTGRPFEFTIIQAPIKLKLHLPSGREIPIFSRFTPITMSGTAFDETPQEEDVVVKGVEVAPMMESVAPDELINEFDQIASDLPELVQNPNSRGEFANKSKTWCSAVSVGAGSFEVTMEKDIKLSIWPRNSYFSTSFFSRSDCFLVLEFWDVNVKN